MSGHECDTCYSTTCVVVGVVANVLGSIGMNVGQNVQSIALANLEPDKRTRPFTSRLWIIGFVSFFVSSAAAMLALALASASILLPLESLMFIVNIIFNRIVRKRFISSSMFLGVGLVMGGIALFVAEGPTQAICVDQQELHELWRMRAWIIWELVSLCGGILFYLIWWLFEADPTGKLWCARCVEPLAFALSAGLLGGGQLVVHTKTLSTLLEMDIDGADGYHLALFTEFFWFEIGLIVLTGVYWLFRLNEGLARYDPLFIIPVMQTSFIVFGMISGGIFFQEFDQLDRVGLLWYSLGIGTTLLGIFVIGTAPTDGMYEPKSPQGRGQAAKVGSTSCVDKPTTASPLLKP